MDQVSYSILLILIIKNKLIINLYIRYMENNTVVYRHVRLDTNEVFYIGIGTEKRPYRKDKRSKFWKVIIDKTDYRVDIMFYDMSWEEACEKEKELIQLYGRRDLGTGTLVNLTDGGDGTYGMTHSKQSRAKISKSLLGRCVSSQTRKLLSDMRQGVSKSQEHKKRISESHKIKVLQLTLDDVLVKIWDSANDAELLGGYCHSNIGKVCKGKRKTHKGYKWKYKDV